MVQNKCGETDEEFKPDWMPGIGKVPIGLTEIVSR